MQVLQERERSDEPEEHLSELTAASRSKAEHVLITYIRVTDVAAGLRRIPAGFYVVVKDESMTRRMSNKPVSLGKDMVEWDDEIPLPSDPSSRISFSVIASFELGLSLGSGEVLCKFEATVGELLDCEQLERVECSEQDDGGVNSSPTSFEIKVEQRAYGCVAVPHPQETEKMCPLVESTDKGHRALTRYRENREQEDLDDSIRHFEHARDLCPLDHPSRATVLFNLATCNLIHCRINDDMSLDLPINLYRDALHHRPHGQPDHPFTLLSLGVAIGARFQRQHDEADAVEAECLFSQVLGVALPDSYAYHAAALALGSTAGPELIQRTENPQVDDDDDDDDRMVQRLDTALKWIFHPDPEEYAMLDHVGILFCIRFDFLGDLADPKKAIRMLEVMTRSTSDSHPCKASWLDELGHLFLTRYKQSGDVADLEKSISMLEDAVQFTSDDHPDKPFWLDNLSNKLLTRYERSGNIVDLGNAISAREDAVRYAPDGHPNKPLWLSNLGSSLLIRYQHFGDTADLEKSISMFEGAVQFTLDDQSDKSTWLNNLGHSLLSRHGQFGNTVDLERAISIFEDLVQSAPDGHEDEPLWRNNFATSLSTRYECFGNPADLEKSISMLEDVVQSTDNGDLDSPTRLNNLGHLLFTRYGRFGDVRDLEKSIVLREEALRSIPPDLPDRPSWLCSLGSSLSTRYERFGNVVDLKRSISMFEEGVRSTPNSHPNKCLWLNYLGNSLSARYARFGDTTDLERSISVNEDALRLTPADHPNKTMQQNNLGESLLTRYLRFGDLIDLEKSISVLEEAVQSTPDSHPSKFIWLGTLSHSLSTRHQRFGDINDLERSISIREDILQRTPSGHPDKPAQLNDLGQALSARYEHFGDVVDLSKSISVFEDAVRLTPDGHLNRPIWLTSLSSSLLARFQRLGDVSDIDKSISIYQDAVESASDGHPLKPAQLSNLGHSLLTHFKHFGEVAYLERAILVLEDGLRLTPDGHSSKPLRLSNLGHSLSTRHKRSGDVADLEKSLVLFEDAVKFTPDGHPDKPSQLNALTRSLLEHCKLGGDLSDTDISRAISLSSYATRSLTGPSSDRFQASQLWIQSIRLSRNDSASLLQAYTASIDLLPQLAWIGLSLHDRYHQLLQAADGTCDAAAAALEAHKPELAVEWLEQGRSIMWSQFSQLRTPIDDIRALYPDLATQFEHVSHELEHASSRGRVALDQLTKQSNTVDELLEGQARQHHALALSREKLLAEIRALPGFERFLLPKTIDQLSPLAHSGPVVFLNASKHRCDALVVLGGSEGVIHVPLSNTCYDEVAGMRLRLSKMLRLNGRVIQHDNVERGARVQGMSPSEVFGSVLPYLWNKVVSPVLEVLGFSTLPSHELPRIFWCPTGPFTFLPIHAAGLYNGAVPGTKISDFAISSYIPTISALELPPPGESKRTFNKVRLLGVPQPGTDGQAHLTGVRREMEVIRELTSSSPFVGFQEVVGSAENVLESMADTDWVHFACHGIQDRTNPFDSGLLLAHRERLKISDIVRLSRPHGGLAFLSACQTAAGDDHLSEEAIHVAAGMLLAGYRGAIATMWSISDSDAPRVAEDVYKRLFQHDSAPNSGRAAEALHYAIKRLCDSGASFLSWVPFIHVGL